MIKANNASWKASKTQDKELKSKVRTNTVKLGIKELFNKEQIGNSEPFPVTNLQVYLINSEQIGISEQFRDDQKVP